MSQPLSVRLNDATIRRLGPAPSVFTWRPGPSRRATSRKACEWMSIRWSGSPTGRSARLIRTGKDIWEVIVVVRDNGGDAAESARHLEIPLGLVQAAIAALEEILNRCPGGAPDARAMACGPDRDHRLRRSGKSDWPRALGGLVGITMAYQDGLY